MRPPAPVEPTHARALQEKEITALRAQILRLQEELAKEKRKAAVASCPTETRVTESSEDSILEKVARLIDSKLAAAGIGDTRSNSTSGKRTKAPSTTTHQGVGGPIGEVARRAVPPRNIKKRMTSAAEIVRAADVKDNRTNKKGAEMAMDKGNATHHRRPSEPSPTETEAEGEWAKVVGRRTKKQPAQEGKEITTRSRTSEKRSVLPARPPAGPTQIKKKEVKLAKTPPRAAVALTLESPTDKGYAEVMAAAKERVDLSELGIESVVVKRAMTGGLLLEVGGPGKEEKAAILAAVLKPALHDKNVRVFQPTKWAELRVSGLDDSVTPKELAEAVAREGECQPEEVKCGEIKTPRFGLGTAWLKCSLKAAKKIINSGRIRVGWASARVQALEARRLQCYRCLDFGHVGARCPNAADCSGTCFKCGETGHRMAACKAEYFKCPLCARRGCDSSHKMGGRECNPPPAPRKEHQEHKEEKRMTAPASATRSAIATTEIDKAASSGEKNGAEGTVTPTSTQTPMETAPEEGGK